MSAAASRGPVRILLVDDSLDFLEAAVRFLAADPRLEIVGGALSGRDGLKRVAELRPDLVLVDLAMPEMDGLEATRQIKKLAWPPRVIILTLHDSPDYRAAARAVYADDFISKSDFGTELLPLIHRMFARPDARTPG